MNVSVIFNELTTFTSTSVTFGVTDEDVGVTDEDVFGMTDEVVVGVTEEDVVGVTEEDVVGMTVEDAVGVTDGDADGEELVSDIGVLSVVTDVVEGIDTTSECCCEIESVVEGGDGTVGDLQF